MESLRSQSGASDPVDPQGSSSSQFVREPTGVRGCGQRKTSECETASATRA